MATDYRSKRNYENMQKVRYTGTGKYEIPVIEAISYSGCKEFIGFNYASTCKEREGKGVHFFVDDYQFTRIWSKIDRYISMFSEFDYVLTPDFSTYTDFPVALQIYNHYRKHWLGAYMQDYGIKVIPTISWIDLGSFAWCFDGEPEGGTVAVSSVGVLKNKNTKLLFIQGYTEMVKRLHPETILFYGDIPMECTGNIVHIRAFQDKFKEAKCNGW